MLVIGVVGLLFASLACEVSPDDLVGNWRIRNRDLLSDDVKAAIGTIVLREGRQFVAVEVPDEVDEPAQHRFRLLSGSGTWRLTTTAGSRNLELVFSDLKVKGEDARGQYLLGLVSPRDSRGLASLR